MVDQPKPRGRPPRDYSALPLPAMIDGRWVWRRSQVENFRRALAGEPPTKAAKATEAGDAHVTITELADELGVSRRTVVRLVEALTAPDAKPIRLAELAAGLAEVKADLAAVRAELAEMRNVLEPDK